MTSAHYDDQFFNKNMVTMLGDGRRPYNGQKPPESVVIDGADSDVCVGDKSDSASRGRGWQRPCAMADPRVVGPWLHLLAASLPSCTAVGGAWLRPSPRGWNGGMVLDHGLIPTSLILEV